MVTTTSPITNLSVGKVHRNIFLLYILDEYFDGHE